LVVSPTSLRFLHIQSLPLLLLLLLPPLTLRLGALELTFPWLAAVASWLCPLLQLLGLATLVEVTCPWFRAEVAVPPLLPLLLLGQGALESTSVPPECLHLLRLGASEAPVAVSSVPRHLALGMQEAPSLAALPSCSMAKKP